MLQLIPRPIYYQIRRLFLGSYYRLIHFNYDHLLFAPKKQLCGGTVRSYELYNRHGTDQMLAEIHAYCSKDAVVYDIGANVGVYSLSLAVEAPERTIIAFEPSPVVYEQLNKNISLNAVLDQVETRQCGVGDRTAVEPFYTSTYTELSSFQSEGATRWEAQIAATEHVDIVTLDTFVKTNPQPDVIKIDVEGTEASVLRGGAETLTQHRPIVFIELHEDGLRSDTAEACRALLYSYGYDISERSEYWICKPV